MRTTISSLWLAGTLAFAAPAVGQDTPLDEGAEERDARARELFGEGTAAYSEGRYEEALAAFEQAYQLSERPKLLYNIALAHDRLRQDRQALHVYERFLTEVEDFQNRAEVERRVEILRRATREAAAPTVESAPPEPEPEPHPSEAPEAQAADVTDRSSSEGTGLLPWIVLGGSGAVALGSGVLFAVGAGEASSVEDAPDGAAWSEYEGAADRGGLFQTLGVIGMAAGLAGVAAGAALLFMGDEEEATLTAGATPSGLLVRGVF